MRFEWDERERQANLAKHGLDFLGADLIFSRGALQLSIGAQGRGEMGDVGLLEGREGSRGSSRSPILAIRSPSMSWMTSSLS